MSSQSVAANRFQSEVSRRADSASSKAIRLWNQVPLNDLEAGWLSIRPDLVAVVSAAVAQNAAGSQQMVNRVARADRLPAGDVVVPNAFVGIDSSGRSLDGLLHGAVTTTKERIGAGVAGRAAFLSGAAYLAAMTKTVVADMARSASSVSAAGRNYVRYVRVVSAEACSRCAILAGSDRFRKHFERHPACKCTSVPVQEFGDVPDGLHASPMEHFNSLSEAEQNRIYTRSGAEAIRLGADPIQVVGARRGASGMSYSRAYPAPLNSSRRMQRVQIGVKPDGSPITGYVTSEGITRRGVYGRTQMRIGEQFARQGHARYATASRSRLMPETILELTDDTNLRRVLLRDAGYLETPIKDMSTNAWIQERLRLQQLDRVAADTFYRSLGVDLY